MIPSTADDTERLRKLWSRFEVLKFPSIRAAEELIGEDAYDLLDAEGYIAGLVQTFLTRRGRISVSTINFDSAAHQRGLDRLAAATTTDFSKVREYATLVSDMATTLSRASGVPLRPAD
jgi:hypothetical protein